MSRNPIDDRQPVAEAIREHLGRQPHQARAVATWMTRAEADEVLEASRGKRPGVAMAALICAARLRRADQLDRDGDRHLAQAMRQLAYREANLHDQHIHQPAASKSIGIPD